MANSSAPATPAKPTKAAKSTRASRKVEVAPVPASWKPHRPERPWDKAEGGQRFELVSDYTPKGDQPQAIKEIGRAHV